MFDKTEYMRRYYANRRKNGICTACGKPVEESRKGKAVCGICRSIRYVKRKEHWKRAPKSYAKVLVKNAEYLHARRLDRIAKGLCPECGRPNKTALRLCPDCHARQLEYEREYYARKHMRKMPIDTNGGKRNE